MKSFLKLFLPCVILLIAMQLHAASRGDERYRDYISQYAPMAIEQQKKYRIPASITLAQGLLESGAGTSLLATEGKNHFGIKCHKDWEGEWMLRNDDNPNECFRVYESVEESFRDHSIFLTKSRYRSLFDLEVTDYAGWAHGLKRCGYATDPNYGTRLIAIIERYNLFEFDLSETPRDEIADFIRSELSKTHPVRKIHGLHFVIALPGDTYTSLAKEFKMSKKNLMAYNDSEGDEIKAWEEVYLQEKNSEGPADVKVATIGDDESLHSLSQRFGIKMGELRKINPDIKGEPGDRVRLH